MATSLPTLMLKGKLRSPVGDEAEQKRLDEFKPIDYIINWFKDRIYKNGIENRVLILKSETASGKSTMFPPELYKSMVRGKQGPGIICTQPRVVTSVENVNEILNHYSSILKLGENIGWSTKFNKILTKTSVGLLSATIGTLAAQLRVLSDEEIMKKYQYILIDETHERDLNTDITIYMLKNLLIRNQHLASCPFVVLMSATFDPESFLNYFNIKKESNFIWCVGAAAGFEKMWNWNEGRTVNNYPQAAAQIVETIMKDGAADDPLRGDVMVFLPGKQEFTMTAEWLDKLNQKQADEGLPVFSLLQIDRDAVQAQNIDYVRTMYLPITDYTITIKGAEYQPARKVILTTNVAETGLTISTLKYVIDAGFNREMEYYPVYGIRGLITKAAPKSRITQRMGRAGRKFRGVFYPLYPEYVYEMLPDLQLPQILSEDISPIILDIINEQVKAKVKAIAASNTDARSASSAEFSISDIDMLDVPAVDALHSAIEKLYSLGFLSFDAPVWNEDPLEIISAEPAGKFGISRIGAIARLFSSVSLEIARMILGGYYWGCAIDDLITIAAFLMVDNRSLLDADAVLNQEEIKWKKVYKVGLPSFLQDPDRVRLIFGDQFIDGIILYNAMKFVAAKPDRVQAYSELRKWCKTNNISYESCLNIVKAREEIIEQLLTAEIDIYANGDKALADADESNIMEIVTRIKYCIYDGFRNNMMTKRGSKYYTTMNLEVRKPKLFKESAELDKIDPEYVIYNSISLKLDPNTTMFEAIPDRVCILDGFVSPDLDFII